jgi:hypothetical protein
LKFRELFFTYWDTTFLKWGPFPQSVLVNTRANLHLFDKNAQLKHSPWFTIKRNDAIRCLTFRQVNRRIYDTICHGKVANESIFAIMLMTFKQLVHVKNEDTHLSDWSRMMTATSPYLFKEGTKKNPFSNVLLTQITDEPNRKSAPPSFNVDVDEDITQNVKRSVQMMNPSIKNTNKQLLDFQYFAQRHIYRVR